MTRKLLDLVILIVLATLTAVPVRAWAYNFAPACCGLDDIVDGNSATYRILGADFTAAQEAEIDLAAAAWRSGSSRLNRGADFEFQRGSDVTDYGTSNLRNDIAKESAAWIANNGGEVGAGAVTLLQSTLGVRQEADMWFNEELVWSVNFASDTDNYSIGQAATHEFGHVIGLDHEEDTVTGMNEDYPSGGDIGEARYRIHEDDYAGLVDAKGDSSTGVNLMLSKYRSDGTSAGDRQVDEVWDVSDVGDEIFTLGYCPGNTLPTSEQISGLRIGTGTSTATEVEWRFSTDTSFSAGDILIGSRSVTLYTNQSNGVLSYPTTFTVPSGVTLGASYRMVVKVDPDLAVSESSDVDNVIAHDAVFVIKSTCP